MWLHVLACGCSSENCFMNMTMPMYWAKFGTGLTVTATMVGFLIGSFVEDKQ